MTAPLIDSLPATNPPPISEIISPIGGAASTPVKSGNAFSRFWTKAGVGIKNVSLKVARAIAKAAKAFYRFAKSPGGAAIALFAVGATLVGTAHVKKLRGKTEIVTKADGSTYTVSTNKPYKNVIQALMIIAGTLLIGAAVALGTLAGVNKNSWARA